MMHTRRRRMHRGASTIAWAVSAGVVLAMVVVLIGWFIEPEPTKTRRRHRDVDVTDLVTPDALTREEQERASTSPEGSSVKLEDGAWVQVADASGMLEQQYSAERIDPLPDGWLQMRRPRAMIYLSGGRIVTLRGESGLVNVPQQAIESGTLTGDVVIRLFVPRGSRPIEIGTSKPEVIVRTEEASFDSVLGEIRCNKSIRIDAEGVSFEGIGLGMLLGENERTIERLVVEEATEPVRIRRGADSETPASPPGDVASAQTKKERVGQAATEAATETETETLVSTERAEERFYRLELERDVRIEQFVSVDAPAPDSTVRGDRLVAVFSLEGDGLDAAGAPASSTTSGASAVGMSREGVVASVALARVQEDTPQDEAELILIHYSGRMVMVPAAPEEHPPTVDDVWIRIQGEEQDVRVTDAPSEATVRCGTLFYRSHDDRVDLLRDDRHPLTVSTPRFDLVGERFWFARNAGLGGLEGPGSMRFMQAREEVDPTVGLILPAVPGELLAMRGSGGGPTLERRIFSQEEPGTESTNSGELEIDWSSGVDLRFRLGTDRLEEALFKGDVQVDNSDFKLIADSLDVLFAEEEGEEADAIEQIIARGTPAAPARASRKGEAGMLAATMLELSLTRSKSGRTVPATLRAEGGVEASDPEQTIWTESLDVLFAETAEGQESPAVGAGASQTELGATEFEEVTATDGVQVLLADGTRVWSKTLAGSGTRRELTLGANDGSLVVIRGNVVTDHLHQMHFDEERRNAQSKGPGRFRYFDEPIVMPASGPISPPSLEGFDPSMEATWAELMDFDDKANDGAGALELHGDVIVRNRPDPLEANDLDADRLRLDFAERGGPPVINSDGNAPSADELSAFSGSRDVRTLIATGAAHLESRTWLDATHTGDPDLFRITGEQVRYDAVTGEGSVEGAGKLLVNQLSGAPEESSALGVALGGDGTTRFSWAEGMQMRRKVADRYLVSMNKAVEVLHAGLRPEDTLTLTADKLDVLLDRPASASVEEGTGDAVPPSAKTLDLGARAEILRVTATGRVFVRTPDQDVECEVFDYDAGNQIARLSAREGRLVTVLTKGATTPVRAEGVTWDMKTGRIQITGAVGGAGSR